MSLYFDACKSVQARDLEPTIISSQVAVCFERLAQKTTNGSWKKFTEVQIGNRP